MVPNLAHSGQTVYPWCDVMGNGQVFSRAESEPPTTCHCTSMPLICLSHLRFSGKESLRIKCHGTCTQLNLPNSFISPMSGCGKGGKGLGKGEPSITTRFFVTTSKVGFT